MGKKAKKAPKKEQIAGKKGKVGDFKVEISQTRSDVKTFIEQFKSDVKRKKKDYQSYAQRLRKKKP